MHFLRRFTTIRPTDRVTLAQVFGSYTRRQTQHWTEFKITELQTFQKSIFLEVFYVFSKKNVSESLER